MISSGNKLGIVYYWLDVTVFGSLGIQLCLDQLVWLSKPGGRGFDPYPYGGDRKIRPPLGTNTNNLQILHFADDLGPIHSVPHHMEASWGYP